MYMLPHYMKFKGIIHVAIHTSGRSTNNSFVHFRLSITVLGECLKNVWYTVKVWTVSVKTTQVMSFLNKTQP